MEGAESKPTRVGIEKEEMFGNLLAPQGTNRIKQDIIENQT
jgi:hypothetical protein